MSLSAEVVNVSSRHSTAAWTDAFAEGFWKYPHMSFCLALRLSIDSTEAFKSRNKKWKGDFVPECELSALIKDGCVYTEERTCMCELRVATLSRPYKPPTQGRVPRKLSQLFSGANEMKKSCCLYISYSVENYYIFKKVVAQQGHYVRWLNMRGLTFIGNISSPLHYKQNIHNPTYILNVSLAVSK